MAALEWFAAGGIISVVFRKHLKGFLKKVCDKFRKPLHEHLQQELNLHKEFVENKLAEHHENIMKEVRKINGKEDT